MVDNQRVVKNDGAIDGAIDGVLYICGMKYDVNKTHHRWEVYRRCLRDYTRALDDETVHRWMRWGVCYWAYMRYEIGDGQKGSLPEIGRYVEWNNTARGRVPESGAGFLVCPAGDSLEGIASRVKMLECVLRGMKKPTFLQRVELFLLGIPNWFRK